MLYDVYCQSCQNGQKSSAFSPPNHMSVDFWHRTMRCVHAASPSVHAWALTSEFLATLYLENDTRYAVTVPKGISRARPTKPRHCSWPEPCLKNNFNYWQFSDLDLHVPLMRRVYVWAIYSSWRSLDKSIGYCIVDDLDLPLKVISR